MVRTMEEMMNESMEDVYHNQMDDEDAQPLDHTSEIDSILRQAVDNGKREYWTRIQDVSKGPHINLRRFSVPLHTFFPSANAFGIFHDPLSQRSDTATTLSTDSTCFPTSRLPAEAEATEGILDSIGDHICAMAIPNLDISIDMLQRLISKDDYAVNQLGLLEKGGKNSKLSIQSKPFIVGYVHANEFVAFDISNKSLCKTGIKNGDTLWVLSSEDQRRSGLAARMGKPI